MDKKVDLRNIYSLKNFVNCDYLRKNISDLMIINLDLKNG